MTEETAGGESLLDDITGLANEEANVTGSGGMKFVEVEEVAELGEINLLGPE